jgi:hypothetical protein
MPSPIDLIIRVLGGPAAGAELHKTEAAIGGVKTEAQSASRALADVNTQSQRLGGTTSGVGSPFKVMHTDANRAAQSVGFARHEVINLGYQLNDVAVGLVSGQSPFTVLFQQGAQIAQIAIASKVTLGGFFSQLATGAAKAAGPISLVAAGITALTTAWLGFKASVAENDAAKALESLSASNRKFGDSILNQLDRFVAEGRIKAERAKEISAMLRNAFGDEGLAHGAKMPLGNGGLNAAQPGMVSDLLVSLGRELRATLPRQLSQAAADAHREAGMARLEAERGVQKALAALQLQELDNSYRQQKIPLEGYLARRTQIAVQEHAREVKLIEAQQFDLQASVLAADDDQKEKLAVKAAALIAEKKQAAIELEKELSRIAADGAEERGRRVKAIEDRNDAQRRALKDVAHQQFQDKTGSIGADFHLTSPERYNKLREAAEAARQAGTITADEFARFREQLGPDPTSWLDQWTNGFARLADAWGTLQEQVVGTGLGLIDSGIDTFSRGMANAAVVTGRVGDALKNIRNQILVGIVGAMIQMGTQWVATHVLMKAVTAAWSAFTGGVRAADVAATTTAESTKAAAAAPAATLISISSYGLAAAIGLAAVVGALASLAFREHGGPVEAGRPYIVGEKRPELFIPRTAGMIVPRVPAPDYGGVSSGGGAGAASGQSFSGRGGSQMSVGIQMHGSVRDAIEGAIVGGQAENYLVDLVRREIRKFNPGA